jgi:glucose-1-phosphate cytidylyltransferase
MKAVILAGGRGSRISEETIHRPKPLIEVGGRPMLWHIMQLYSHHDISEFIICAGYRGYLIKEYFANFVLHDGDVTLDFARNTVTHHNVTTPPWRVTIADTGLDTQTGGRLLRIAPYLAKDEPFCMTYGDGIGDVDIRAAVRFHQSHGLKATMTVVRPPARFGAVRIEGDRVREFLEKERLAEGGEVNGGFFVLSPSVLDLVRGDDTVWEGEPLESLAQSGQLACYRHTGFWQPMDTQRDRTLLEELWQSGRPPWRTWS